jgi:hypothetical protein
MEVSGQIHSRGHFTPMERAPGTHWIGSWVDPRAVLGAVVKRKIPSTKIYCEWALCSCTHFLLLEAVLRGSFENFVDSPYYSESGLCSGKTTICFSKYLPWQAMHFLQRSTHFSKTCCRPFAASFRRIVEQAELPFRGWKSPEIAWGEIWTVWWMV